jgi:hypothetical protein
MFFSLNITGKIIHILKSMQKSLLLARVSAQYIVPFEKF